MMRSRRTRRGAVLLLIAGVWIGCATGGKGTSPPLPGEPGFARESDPVSGDDGAAPPPGDDGGSVSDDGGSASDENGDGGTCDDALHGLKALFVLPAVPCTSSFDCPSGDCCFVSGSSSTCVMQ
jgi:hypothetical protein